MMGIDTNVLVRYLTLDDARQAPVAVACIDSLSAESPGFISLVVMVELVWVLEGSYQFEKKRIIEILEGMLRSSELVLEQTDTLRQALRQFETSRADFADCLIERCAHAAECEYTLTFDRRATIAGMRLLR